MDNPLEAQSPPSSKPDEAPRQLPSLPTEILQRIIQLALPRLSFKTFRERYDILLNCCRVNKLSAALAQRELVKHVGLALGRDDASNPDDPAQAFPEATRGVNRSLWVTKFNSPSVSLAAVVGGFSGLKALHNTSRSGPSDLSFVQLSEAAPALEVLAIDLFTIIKEPSTSPKLAFLRRLALSYPTNVADLSSLLESAELPRLEDLAINTGIFPDTDSADRLGHAIRRHAARVRRFSFTLLDPLDPFPLPQDVWQTFTVLKHLALDSAAPLDAILPSLPTPLTSFRLRPPFDDKAPTLKGLLDVMRSRPHSLHMLSELTLDILGRPEPACAEDKEVENLCREQGIQVTRRDGLAHADYAERLEDSLDFW